MIINWDNLDWVTDNICENFLPQPREWASSLYEVMHCFGSGYWIKNIEAEIKKSIDELITEGIIEEPTVIIFNNKNNLNRNVPYIELDCKKLSNQHNIVSWINTLTFQGVVFYGETNDECLRSMAQYYKDRRPDGFANCVSDPDNPDNFTVNLMMTYYDGSTLGFLRANDDFRTIIYHELMHAYQNSKSNYKVKQIDITSNKACKDILTSYEFKIRNNYHISEDEENLYKLVKLIYVLSPRERAAFMGQQNQYFSDASINSKEDFYIALENSAISKHIQLANEVIDFLNGCNYKLDKNSYIRKEVENIISFYIDPQSTNPISTPIRKFIHIIQDNISDMKNDLHNIAYWSLSDKTKRNILEDYIYRY